MEKSSKGWGMGLHRYEVALREPWITPRRGTISISVSHQDQVVAPPPNSRPIAESAFTPFAALAALDQPAISFQGHPEFSQAFARALLRHLEGSKFTSTETETAIGSFDRQDDRHVVGTWISRFIDHHLGH